MINRLTFNRHKDGLMGKRIIIDLEVTKKIILSSGFRYNVIITSGIHFLLFSSLFVVYLIQDKSVKRNNEPAFSSEHLPRHIEIITDNLIWNANYAISLQKTISDQMISVFRMDLGKL
jgi:hypothetical protein